MSHNESNRTVYTVFFSPTMTSRAITQAVARGMGGSSPVVVDLTHEDSFEVHTFLESDLVLIGMPVYGGRLPTVAVERFRALRGTNTSVVMMVVYGNRAYEDALIEGVDLAIAQGFEVKAAAAFVGQHSFSSTERPIADGRPDATDLKLAEEWGAQIRTHFEELPVVAVEGSRPYKVARQPRGESTGFDAEICTSCGRCVARCPMACIKMGPVFPETQSDNCIWCMACVQGCPSGARKVIQPKVFESAQRLYENATDYKCPQLFPSLEYFGNDQGN